MAKQVIGIGAAPNDGTGDLVRDAFDKTNDNFTEVYSAEGLNTTHRGLTTGNPHSVTKAEVGLTDVDDTADSDKPISTDQQTALDLKAPLASPTFTGTVISPVTATASLPASRTSQWGINKVIAAGGTDKIIFDTGNPSLSSMHVGGTISVLWRVDVSGGSGSRSVAYELYSFVALTTGGAISYNSINNISAIGEAGLLSNTTIGAPVVGTDNGKIEFSVSNSLGNGAEAEVLVTLHSAGSSKIISVTFID